MGSGARSKKGLLIFLASPHPFIYRFYQGWKENRLLIAQSSEGLWPRPSSWIHSFGKSFESQLSSREIHLPGTLETSWLNKVYAKIVGCLHWASPILQHQEVFESLNRRKNFFPCFSPLFAGFTTNTPTEVAFAYPPITDANSWSFHFVLFYFLYWQKQNSACNRKKLLVPCNTLERDLTAFSV